MNDAELNRILKAAGEPKRAPGYWEQFSRDVRVQLRRTPATGPMRTQAGYRLAWIAATAVILLVAGFAINHWRGQGEATASGGLLQNANAVQEMMAMFPNRVRAIVQDTNGLNLVLSDQDDVPDSPPIYVQICDGKHCSTMVTFSGQEIQLAGQTITTLSDAKGGVLVVGDHFLWSKHDSQRPVGALRIDARELTSTGAS